MRDCSEAVVAHTPVISAILLQVHDMLVRVANSLVDGGETGVFSPMHLLLFRKPLEGEGANGEPQAAAKAAAGSAAEGAKSAKKAAAKDKH